MRTLIHLVGYITDSGTLSIAGLCTHSPIPQCSDWIVVHIVEHHRMQEVTVGHPVRAFTSVAPILRSPIWLRDHYLYTLTTRAIGQLIGQNILDITGEFLIFPGAEEWCHLLNSLVEAAPEEHTI